MIGVCLFLQACSQIDDYLLGKDNTPQPKALPALEHARVSFKEKWAVNVGKSSSNSAYFKLLPAISGDVLYVAEPRGLVMAIQKSTGNVLWSTQLSQGLASGPVVSQNVIALGTNHASVIVLDAKDGHERWQVNVSNDVLSSPLIVGDRVIVKTIDGYLYAFNLLSSKKLWKVEHGAPSLILKASSSPVRKDNMVLVGFSDGKLDAMDIDTGRVLWQRSITYANGSSDVERLVDIDADPIVRGDVVYLATYQGYVGAMSLDSGQFVWSKPASTYKNLSLDSDALYMTDSQDTIWSIHRNNGQVKWKQLALSARGLTAPTYSDNHVFVGDKTGLLHVIDAQSGESVGRVSVGHPIYVAPVISGHDAYVMTASGQLICFSVGK
jgi:outer membrane protein assembly factor BamB